MAMLLTIGMGVQAAGQKHRHTPQAELVDSTSKNAVEVYSDTTSTDTANSSSTVTKRKGTVTVTYPTSPWSSRSTTYEVDDDDAENIITNLFNDMDHKDLMGMFFVLCVLLIVFVLAPVLIIIALFYFINKNRKQKMKLAQMAMQQGQPIPDQLLKEQSPVGDEEYKSGLRQCFVGVGLMIFLWFAAGEVGFGIGALVFCIGLGKVIVAKSTASKNNFDMTHENKDNF